MVSQLDSFQFGRVDLGLLEVGDLREVVYVRHYPPTSPQKLQKHALNVQQNVRNKV